LPIVLYSAGYSTDGKRIAITANDAKAYLIDRPPPSRQIMVE
jgi:hypothetical protein